jgi:flagellar biosynthesis/type III secretory pathway M-ring protein FliF/YscJ
MRNFLNDLLVQLKGIWSRLDGGQRLIVCAVLGATVVGLGGIVWYAGQPTYEVVFTASSKDDITAAKRALESASIGYQWDDSGMTFRVERARMGAANAALKEAGLGSRSETTIGGSSSIIDDAETKAWKLDNASRALAENAIRQLEGVLAVTVTASKPRRVSAFRDRDHENRSGASVILRLKPGASFDAVARSAMSLTASQLMIPPANIEVFSASGSQRYRYDPDRETGGGSSEFLTLQHKIGEERTAQAQQLLDTMWPGKTSVAVTVELDPRWEIRSEKVLPTEPIVRSQKTSKDTTSTAVARTVDASGTKPDAQPAPENSSKNETKDTDFVTEIGERRTGMSAPEIKRLTVAVLYDRSLEKTEGFNQETLVKAIKATVGWNKDRDADESFSVMPGDFTAADPAAGLEAGPGFGDLALRWGPTVGQVFGVIVVIVFLRGLFRRVAPRPEPAAETATPAAQSAEEQQRRMRREIERSIATDPAALAKLLESWLTEQKA